MLFPGKGFSLLSSHFAYLMDFLTKLGRPRKKLFRGPAQSAGDYYPVGYVWTFFVSSPFPDSSSFTSRDLYLQPLGY